MATGMFGPAVEDIEATISAENWKKRYQGGALEDDIGNLFQSGFGLAAKALGAEDPRVSKAKKMKEAAAEAQANAKPGDTKDLYLQLSKSFEKYGFPEEALKAATAYRTMTREDKADFRADKQEGRLDAQQVMAEDEARRKAELHDRAKALWKQDDAERTTRLETAKLTLKDLQAKLNAMPKDFYDKEWAQKLRAQTEEQAAWVRAQQEHEARLKLVKAQTGAANAQAEKAYRELASQWDIKVFTDFEGNPRGAVMIEKNPKRGEMPKIRTLGPDMKEVTPGAETPAAGKVDLSDPGVQDAIRRGILLPDGSKNPEYKAGKQQPKPEKEKEKEPADTRPFFSDRPSIWTSPAKDAATQQKREEYTKAISALEAKLQQLQRYRDPASQAQAQAIQARLDKLQREAEKLD